MWGTWLRNKLLKNSLQVQSSPIQWGGGLFRFVYVSWSCSCYPFSYSLYCRMLPRWASGVLVGRCHSLGESTQTGNESSLITHHVMSYNKWSSWTNTHSHIKFISPNCPAQFEWKLVEYFQSAWMCWIEVIINIDISHTHLHPTPHYFDHTCPTTPYKACMPLNIIKTTNTKTFIKWEIIFDA